MNIIILDTETHGLLYGFATLKQISLENRSQNCRILYLPAEAWIAYLKVRHKFEPAVARYLAEVNRTGLINPDGKCGLLRDVDDILDISESDAELITQFVRE